MLKNYFKVAIRNMLKRKGYTAINIFGLATGMAVCLLILLFVENEISFDKFNTNADRIYRVALDRKYPDRSTSYAIIPMSIGEAMKKEFPEIKTSTRLINPLFGQMLVLHLGDKVFQERNVLLADSDFFKVFTGNLILGNENTLLTQPKSIVLTESTARRYFGSPANAIGKAVMNDTTAWIVTGVCKDWPANSHFTFDLLISSATFFNGPNNQPNYINFSAYTYLLLNPNADAKALEAKFPVIIQKYVAGAIEKNFGESFQQFVSQGNNYHYYLQPLTKIHLTSHLENELKPNGSTAIVYIFCIVALFILGLACINFINLSTARSMERAREVGIRKTFGSQRNSLITQFLIESVLVSCFSMIIALVFVFLMLPFFNQLAGTQLTMSYFINPLRIGILILVSVVIGLSAGIYPAFVLSSFQPILVLKGRFSSSRSSKTIRNGLVIFQFGISIILIIATLIVNRQLQYMIGDDLGFNKNNTIIIDRADQLGPQTNAFKNELLKIPGVQSISGASAMPGAYVFGASVKPVGAKEAMTGRGMVVDDQYVSTLGLQMTTGRFFSKQFSTDSLALVLNEEAVKQLGLQNPVGAQLTSPDPFLSTPDGKQIVYTVIGVVKDFHFQSLHEKISPLIFVNSSKFGNINSLMAIHVSSMQANSVISGIKKTWNQFVPQSPLDYTFLDKNLSALYTSEETTQQVFSFFSALAIFIACLGLLGLVTYAVQLRIREIGIRKVLGATVSNIVLMLSRDFLKLILIASVVAFPLAWLGMNKWLQDYAYRIEMSWWIFALAGVAALIIALMTISFQAIKAAVANPVKSLRAE